MIPLKNEYEKIAIVNVNVITMKNSKVISNQTVLVNKGLIEQINGNNNIPDGYFSIDGKDKYLLPSLIDMHVHLGDNIDDLMLYLVNGVTTIRNMWGYENFDFRNWLLGTRVFHHLRLKKQIEKGEVIGPQIITAGSMNEGEKSFFPKFMVNVIKSKEQVENMVKRHADNGYDLIKFYSTISKDVFDAIVFHAKKRRIPIGGHVPDSVGLEYVVNAQVNSVEHLFGFFNPYNPELALKESEIPKIADLSAEKNVFHCPTLIASERIGNVEKRKDYENEKEMAYLPNRVKKGMRFLQNASNNLFKKKNLKANHEYIPYLFKIIQQFKKSGVKILLGTDKATPYVVSGFSVHRELKLLCDAGLSPFEAIQTGTITAAQCLNQSNEIGTVEVGKRADLLLTEDNPFIDLDTLRKHCGVIVNGRWISRDECGRVLNLLKKKNT